MTTQRFRPQLHVQGGHATRACAQRAVFRRGQLMRSLEYCPRCDKPLPLVVAHESAAALKAASAIITYPTCGPLREKATGLTNEGCARR